MLMDWCVDAPSEPRDLEITKYDKSSVTLKWKAPTDDGGNPIQGKWLPFTRDFRHSLDLKTIKYSTIVCSFSYFLSLWIFVVW